MSQVGRDALAKIFSSDEYKAWAGRDANRIDAHKIEEEFKGNRRPWSGSKYAQGFQSLCRENPPPAPVPALAEVWRKDACFTEGGLSNFHGSPRERARQTGWTVAYVQLLHTVYQAANEAEIPVFVNAGWQIVGWGTYGQGSDPYQDGLDAAALCRRLPVLKGWKANGEAWAEGQYFWKTESFLKGWTDGGAPVPLGWSVLSSDTANFAREFDYAMALGAVGADIDLQVYGATHPTLTVSAGLGMLSRTAVKPDRTTMSFDVNGDGNGPFPDYLTWKGPRRLWRPDRATVATFDALAR